MLLAAPVNGVHQSTRAALLLALSCMPNPMYVRAAPKTAAECPARLEHHRAFAAQNDCACIAHTVSVQVHDAPHVCLRADVSKGRKQLELVLRTLERAALLSCMPKPKRISLTGHLYLAKVDEREQLSSTATQRGNLQILVHKG